MRANFTNFGDAAIGDADVGVHARGASAVNHRPILDNQIVGH
jgi:hypothetical protein